MNCIVTAGPTHEPLDRVRRMTNFSTGRLGTELAEFLTAQGHRVILLRGDGCTWPARSSGVETRPFGTTESLRKQFQELADKRWHAQAVFHAAAVSDFRFGGVWEKHPDGTLTRLEGGKLSTRQGSLLTELVPTEKLLPTLRGLFPEAWIVGWKYEVDGGREDVLSRARRQLEESATDACIANGPAYGQGFGCVTPSHPVLHLPDAAALFTHFQTRLQPNPDKESGPASR